MNVNKPNGESLHTMKNMFFANMIQNVYTGYPKRPTFYEYEDAHLKMIQSLAEIPNAIFFSDMIMYVLFSIKL